MGKLLHNNSSRVSEFFSYQINSQIELCLSWWKAWDYNPKAGLVMAGGSEPPKSKTVEISVDGKNFTQLPDIPFGWNQQGGCLVIIDEETVFFAGGENNHKGPSIYDVHIMGEREAGPKADHGIVIYKLAGL